MLKRPIRCKRKNKTTTRKGILKKKGNKIINFLLTINSKRVIIKIGSNIVTKLELQLHTETLIHTMLVANSIVYEIQQNVMI